MNDVFISVCIPTYERLDYLKRLIESINIQKYRNFEVIVTDDSKTDQVATFIKNYDAWFPLFYHKNIPALGTSRNMVEGIKYARYQWIKIIHDDDFFSSEYALQEYANATSYNTRFIFSGYKAYFENVQKMVDKTISDKQFRRIQRCPSVLFAENKIGPPSVSMMHISVTEMYDVNLKWFTDMEYYFRVLAQENAQYISKPLVNVSFNDSQITSYVKTNRDVVIPESLYLLRKYGRSITSNILAYDSWWRVYRNLNIRSIDTLSKYAGNDIPLIAKKIVSHINKIPHWLLNIGIFSKICMSISYIATRFIKIESFEH